MYLCTNSWSVWHYSPWTNHAMDHYLRFTDPQRVAQESWRVSGKSLGHISCGDMLHSRLFFFCIAMHCINYVHLLCAFVNMCKCSMRIYPSHGPFSLGLEDMQKLYEEWLSASECWSSSTYVIQLQQTSKFIKMGARRWMTFSQICEKYKSEDVATCIIEEKKKIQC